MCDDKILAHKHILLGVTGSVAAYKAVELASLLTQAGAEAPVIMTAAAQQFIRPLSFESITRQAVYTGMFEGHALEPRHISLAEQADILVIAPATANCVGKLANGLADDLLTCTAMATRAPILLAPAMNDGMYTHPATEANLKLLQERGVHFVGPKEGRLASGKQGIGRMSSPKDIFAAIVAILSGEG